MDKSLVFETLKELKQVENLKPKGRTVWVGLVGHTDQKQVGFPILVNGLVNG